MKCPFCQQTFPKLTQALCEKCKAKAPLLQGYTTGDSNGHYGPEALRKLETEPQCASCGQLGKISAGNALCNPCMHNDNVAGSVPRPGAAFVSNGARPSHGKDHRPLPFQKKDGAARAYFTGPAVQLQTSRVLVTAKLEPEGDRAEEKKLWTRLIGTETLTLGSIDDTLPELIRKGLASVITKFAMAEPISHGDDLGVRWDGTQFNFQDEEANLSVQQLWEHSGQSLPVLPALKKVVGTLKYDAGVHFLFYFKDWARVSDKIEEARMLRMNSTPRRDIQLATTLSNLQAGDSPSGSSRSTSHRSSFATSSSQASSKRVVSSEIARGLGITVPDGWRALYGHFEEFEQPTSPMTDPARMVGTIIKPVPARELVLICEKPFASGVNRSVHKVRCSGRPNMVFKRMPLSEEVSQNDNAILLVRDGGRLKLLKIMWDNFRDLCEEKGFLGIVKSIDVQKTVLIYRTDKLCDMFGHRSPADAGLRQTWICEGMLNKDNLKFIDSEGSSKKNANEDIRTNLLEGFVHYVLRETDFKYAFCDIQGSKSQSGGVVLYDPQSQSLCGDTGVGDKGVEGLMDVTNNHHCSNVCSRLGLENDVKERLEEMLRKEDVISKLRELHEEDVDSLRQDNKEGELATLFDERRYLRAAFPEHAALWLFDGEPECPTPHQGDITRDSSEQTERETSPQALPTLRRTSRPRPRSHDAGEDDPNTVSQPPQKNRKKRRV